MYLLESGAKAGHFNEISLYYERAPSAEAQRELVRTLAQAGRISGAVYDALVALTAKISGAALVTTDRRAIPVYELVGVELRFLDT